MLGFVTALPVRPHRRERASCRRPRLPLIQHQRTRAPVRACELNNGAVAGRISEQHHVSEEDDTEASMAAPQPSTPAPAAEQNPTETPVDPTNPASFLYSASLDDYAGRRAAGLVPPLVSDDNEEWGDAWTLSLAPAKARELKNQYSRLGILMELNFTDFTAAEGASDVFERATIEDLARAKARALYEATGLPSMAEEHDMVIDAPESGSRINKTLQQAYHIRKVEEEGDAMIDRVRPISDENRAVRFYSSVAYFDGEMEIVTYGDCSVAIVFASTRYSTIATAAAFDDMYKELTRRLELALYTPGEKSAFADPAEDEGRKFIAAQMLRDRLMREGTLLRDGILKVSAFINHMVDVDLMEECGVELAERLRDTMPNKVLTVESTGLIPALPVAKTLGIPLLFGRKSRPITISDSFQTTYRSATKGTVNEIVVSCEYLHPGDRVVIIDDFLAGGSTAEALFKLASMAHAKVVGVGVLIEKMSSGGRAFLSGYDVPVESLAKVDIVGPKDEPPRLVVHEEEPWARKEDAVHDGILLADNEDEDDVTIIDDDDTALRNDELDGIEDQLIRAGNK